MTFSESEERITGTWTPESEGHLELNPIENKTGFKTSVRGGNETLDSREDWEHEDTIVKTVQISQLSSRFQH